jgi:hypothetical protein
MKKVLFASLGFLLTLALVLTACPEPTDFTNTNLEGKVINTLDKPGNVTAWAYAPTGYIRVTWDPVPNATGYEIYRRTELNGKATVKYLGASFNNFSDTSRFFYYEDILDFNNEDITGNVTYKVVAYSDWSSNPKTAGSTDLPWKGNSSTSGSGETAITEADWFLLQNSSADSNRVSLSGAPAPGSKIAAPKNLKVSNVKNQSQSGNGGIQLTWDAEPGVEYYVSYGVGGGDLEKDKVKAPLVLGTAVAVSVTNDAQKTAALVIPQIGKTYIEVVASHKGAAYKTGGTAGFTSNGNTAVYYSDSDPATITAEGPAPATFGSVTTLTATQLTDKTVKLSWKKALGATGYKVYRFISDASTYLGGTGATDSGVVYEAWKDITASLTDIANDDDFDNVFVIDNLTTLYDSDNGINGYPSKNLFYVVVAIGPNNTISGPSTVATRTRLITAATLTATNLSANPTTGYTLADGWAGVRLNWITQTYSGVSHKLYRAEVVFDGVAVISEGEYTEIASEDDGFNTVADSNAQHNYGLIDKDLSVRKSYRYRLDTIAADGTVINSNYQSVTSYPYRDQVSISVSVVHPPNKDSTDTDRRKAYITAYRIAGTTTQAALIRSTLLAGEVVKIYRVQVDSLAGTNIIGDYVLVGSIPRDNVGTTIYVEENLGKPGYWKYFALVETTIEGNGAANSGASIQPTLAGTNMGQGSGTWTVRDDLVDPTLGKIVQVLGNGVNDLLNGIQVIAEIRTGYSDVSSAAALQALGDGTKYTEREQTLVLSRYVTQGNQNSNIYRTGLLDLPVSEGTTYYAHRVTIFYIQGDGTRSTAVTTENVGP